MLPSSSCITAPYGGATNHPFACANLNLPHYGGGNAGWHVNIEWVVDHPVASSLILMVVLTIAKAIMTSRKSHQTT